jgi:hypothetical protein
MDTQTKTKRQGPEIGSYGSFPESPYIVELHSKYIQAAPEHRAVEIDGVPHGIYEIPKGRTIPIDTAKYSKLFKNYGMLLANLNEAAIKMFMYIHEHLGVNSDYVCITKEDYLKYYGYAPTNKYTYYQALEGLLKADVMKKKAGSTVCYWINPNILFNGDRTKLKNVKIVPPERPFSFSKGED